MNDQNNTNAVESSYLGYYGKVPLKGDFISKDLPRSFMDPWHVWVKEALACSKNQLGEAWREYYLTTPLYQYVLSPGICGNKTWIGVMMPSLDRVGRYYPMTLSKTVPGMSNPFTLFETCKTWLDGAEKLLLSCLDEDFSVESLDIGMKQLEPDEDDEKTITLQKFTMHNYEDSAWQIPLLNSEKQNSVYPALLDSMAGTFFSSYSLWRTKGSDLISPSIVISEDLPPYESVTAFIDGNWKKWGWNDEHIIQQ